MPPGSSKRWGSDEAPSRDSAHRWLVSNSSTLNAMTASFSDPVILGCQGSPRPVNLALPPGKVKHQRSCPSHQTGSSQRLGQGARDTEGWWRPRARAPKPVNLSSNRSGAAGVAPGKARIAQGAASPPARPEGPGLPGMVPQGDRAACRRNSATGAGK